MYIVQYMGGGGGGGGEGGFFAIDIVSLSLFGSQDGFFLQAY